MRTDGRTTIERLQHILEYVQERYESVCQKHGRLIKETRLKDTKITEQAKKIFNLMNTLKNERKGVRNSDQQEAYIKQLKAEITRLKEQCHAQEKLAQDGTLES